MRRLLALWLVLIASFWIGRIILSLSLYSAIDLTYRAFLELIVVPGLQAAAVTWATRRQGTAAAFQPWRLALARPTLRLVLGLDLAVLAAAWLALVVSRGAGPAAPLAALGFGSASGLPRLALALKLAAAAALLAAGAGLRAPAADQAPGLERRGGARAAARLALLSLAVVLAVAAVEPLTGWIAGGPDRLFAAQPLLVRWLRFTLPLLLGLVLLLLAAQAALARTSAAAGRAMDWALAGTLAAAAVLAGGFFLHPYLRDPWRTVAWTLTSGATSALLVAAVLNLAARGGRPTETAVAGAAGSPAMPAEPGAANASAAFAGLATAPAAPPAGAPVAPPGEESR